MNNYPPTAEIPVVNPQKRRMLQALFSESRQDFMMTLYKIAEEDLARPLGNSRYSKKPPLCEMIKDRNSGALDMLKLLLTMSNEVLESLILNTIGSKFQLEPDFKKLFHSMEGSGVYRNTIMSANHPGRGLSGSEWALVTAMISRYIRSHRIVIGGNSTAMQRSDALEASRIENAYGQRSAQNGKRSEPYLGQRFWLNQGDTTQTFCRNLGSRSNVNLDNLQRVRQIQSPCEVGMSNDLATRIRCHQPESGLRNTVKPWGLVLSCLKVLEIDFKVVSIPVLKVWDRLLIGKAEVLITFLAGSSFDEGGFNAAPPGMNKSLAVPRPLPNEQNEIFDKNDAFLSNLRECEEDLTKKDNSLQTLLSFQTQELEDTLEERKNELKDLRSFRREQSRDMKDATVVLEMNHSSLHMGRINEVEYHAGSRSRFNKNLDNWLKNTSPTN